MIPWLIRRRGNSPLRLLIPVFVIMVIMLAIFLPVGNESEDDNIVIAAEANPPTIQSGAAERLLIKTTQRDDNDGGKTSPKPGSGEVYVDAEGVVPQYSDGLVQTKDGLTIGVNSPTKKYSPEAYVVSMLPILENEYQDIIDFEQKDLGLSGHKSAEEYAMQQMSFQNSITHLYGSGGSTFQGAVGPAVTIRDFRERAQDYINGKLPFYSCFDGQSPNVDAMLVKNGDVQKYLNGGDVDVVYVQFKITDGKAHAYPWGITQTYIQGTKPRGADPGGLLPNQYSGAATSTNFGTVPLTGDNVKDLEGVWGLAKKLASDGNSIYWWPGILATDSNAGISQKASTYGMPSPTSSIFESYNNSAFSELSRDYTDYSLVGILVYAVK